MTPASAVVDTLIIGGGAMGSAAAWQLARRGRAPLLLERFAPGHANGASHGASRNFNVSYPDPVHQGLLRESLASWRTLEAEAGVALLDQVGVVNHGHLPGVGALAESLSAAGFAAEVLDPVEAGERWAGLRFTTPVLFTPDAGRLHADRAVEALQRAAIAHGAQVRHGVRVTCVEPVGDDLVRVHVLGEDGDPDGEMIEARRAVVTAGAWTEKLIGGHVALPRLVVTQEQPAHFAVRDDTATWPGFNHAPDPADPSTASWYSGVYGMYTPGEGIKAGWHGVGPVVDPDARTFTPDPIQLDALRGYVRDWIPGADPDRLTAISCTYTTTPDSVFVVDRVGPITVAAGFSGHGFKFTPAIGRLLADLVDDPTAAPELFSLRRPRSATPIGAAARMTAGSKG